MSLSIFFSLPVNPKFDCFAGLISNSFCDMSNLPATWSLVCATGTALMRVQHDITSSLTGSSGVLLALLDLSAAFHTIDASILFNTMNDHLGISGSALTWFNSYMSDRTQRVHIDSDGVPQGSVLGPLLFTVYTTPMHQCILKRHAVEYHKFADDLQIYTSY